jgi:hypothetical protein
LRAGGGGGMVAEWVPGGPARSLFHLLPHHTVETVAAIVGRCEHARRRLDIFESRQRRAIAATKQEAQARLRELAQDFVLPPAACGTWRALYLGLEEFERDVMQHIHLENHVLFPRAGS